MVSTLATHSRIASFTASFSVALPRLHRHHLGAEQLHAPHVQRLALDVDGTHVDDAAETEQRGRGRGGDAVLAGTRLRDQVLLAHAAGQQGLAEHVVDLVRTGVGEVFALEQHAHPEPLREPVALGDRGRPARVARQQRRVLVAESGVDPRFAKVVLELLERGHERLGREAAAELTEPTETDGFRSRWFEAHGQAASGELRREQTSGGLYGADLAN